LLISWFINFKRSLSKSKKIYKRNSFVWKISAVREAFQRHRRLKLFERFAHNFILYTSSRKSRIILVLTYFSTTFSLFQGIEKLAIDLKKIRASELLFLIIIIFYFNFLSFKLKTDKMLCENVARDRCVKDLGGSREWSTRQKNLIAMLLRL